MEKRTGRSGFPSTVLAASAALALSAAPAAADEFFKGKQIGVVIAFSAGSGYDTYARTLARHMTKHIPGNPALVPNNMIGGGGLVAANYLYNLAAKDGTAFGIYSRANILDPLFGVAEAKFDAAKFGWLGSMGDEVSVCISWHKSPVKTWGDLIGRDFVAASTAASADTSIFPLLFNELFGTKFKVVNGYGGGPEMSKAIEDGEADGRCGWSWSAVKATKADWIDNKQISILVQAGLKKAADLPDVPLALDLAKTDLQRQVLALALAPQGIAWPFAAPPGLPPERLEILRAAFMATLADKEFLVDADKQKLGIDPMPGVEVERQIREIYTASPEAVMQAKRLMRPAPGK